MRDEVDASGQAGDARTALGRGVVDEVGVDWGYQPRDGGTHAPLRAQPHKGDVVIEGALEERDVEAVVQRELVAGCGGAKLLVVANE